ncbi:head decoration protein [Vineibacter terrae]|uniref:head decoration protein n=1 Tax=Vineibacter terrae TaxID=2586908 RepID=UPI002E37D97D|nr:head decoration protein [Vineibacter terrae]HEX2888356.1 head decoration protein [Vineibacter terrae]
MPIVTEGNRLSDWLKGEVESPTFFSRDAIAMQAGSGMCPSGLVLARLLTGAAAAAVAFAGNAGNGAMGAVTAGGAARRGTYKLTMIEPAADAGRFTVEDPDGVLVGVGRVAAAFAAGGLSFTLADGAVDFGAGDGFDITVSGGTEKFVPFDPTATDGAQVVDGVLVDAVNAVASDVAAVAVRRLALVSDQGLQWGDNVTTQNQKIAAHAQLRRLGIYVRAGA